MNKKWKISLLVLGGLLGSMVVEQTVLPDCCFSWSVSGTHTYDVYKAPAGELTALTRVEKPLTRWLPLIKFGETVHYHTTWEKTGSTKTIEHGDTTRTRLWVIGFCSTARYDELADRPFENWQENPMNPRVASLRRN